jgi:hypothetical protein
MTGPMTPAGEPLSRTERYMRRVRLYLPRLQDDATRRAFLSDELEKWEATYASFIETSGESQRTGDGANQPTAFDFTATILALQSEQASYRERSAA